MQRPTIAKTHLMLVVHHDPSVDVLVILTEDVGREQIRSVLFADEVRGVDVERVSEISEDGIEGDRGVLQDRPQFLAASHREGNPPTRGRRFSLLALGPGWALRSLVAAVALRAGSATVASFTLGASLAARSTGTRRAQGP